MLDLLIYHLHIVGVLYAAVKRWQHEGVKGAVLAVAICGLVFMIGWSLTGTIARLVMQAPAQPGAWFTVDTLSLVLLLVPEVLFFWMFFVRDRDASDQNVTSANT